VSRRRKLEATNLLNEAKKRLDKVSRNNKSDRPAREDKIVKNYRFFDTLENKI
jgi:hypothetical protein